jgi:UDP-GlcNAc:undecaprenyl-phosphate GlcNAc-1-phosphate transferase
MTPSVPPESLVPPIVPPIAPIAPLPPDNPNAYVMGELLHAYLGVFLVAFLVTLIATPFVRRLAIAMEIIDRPDESRKQHKYPIAYLGGLAVFAGVMAAVAFSFTAVEGPAGQLGAVPVSIIIGILAITFTGLADDVWGWDPRLKIMGQLIAAAALALEDIGTRVAEGAFLPFFGEPSTVLLTIGPMALQSGDIYYWSGTAIIGIFVLGGCNAMNLIDGLDGLCSGVAGIMATALLVLSLLMATLVAIPDPFESLAGVRIVLCLALLGSVLGFLPWNFNPAVIFLGDCGSLLIGYLVVVIILLLGEQGQTHLVFAGLIIFSLPIMDTALAILRRKLAGVSMSQADANHIHHLAKRALGGVKLAVVALYLLTALFGALGVLLGVLVMEEIVRLRIVYIAAIVLFTAIAAVSLKTALRNRWASQLSLEKSQGDASEVDLKSIPTGLDSPSALEKVDSRVQSASDTQPRES